MARNKPVIWDYKKDRVEDRCHAHSEWGGHPLHCIYRLGHDDYHHANGIDWTQPKPYLTRYADAHAEYKP